jgi:hypothetical protein
LAEQIYLFFEAVVIHDFIWKHFFFHKHPACIERRADVCASRVSGYLHLSLMDVSQVSLRHDVDIDQILKLRKNKYPGCIVRI